MIKTNSSTKMDHPVYFAAVSDAMFVTPESLVDLQSLLSPVNMSSCRTTSSPSSAGKTANLNTFVAAGGGRWITSNAINTYLSEKEEDEYDHLQAKPQLGTPNNEAATRRAADMLERLFFNLSRQAYLVKDILLADGQEAKHVGKKRRARLLSDHLDDFNVSVPYSLNRKNRWDALDDTAGCLVGCNTPNSLPTANNQVEPLKFFIVESYFRCNPREANRSEQGIRSYQEFNADGQLLNRKEASSARGSSLHNLMGSSQDAPGVLAPDHQLNVQYRLSQAHPVGKVMGINFAKNKSYKGKCVKRASAELVKSVVCGSQAAARDFLEEEEAQDENEDELLGMYRPKNDTYSLHDFLKENQEEQPVLVRRNKSVESFASGADIEDQYNFVLSSGSQLAESVILKPSTNPSSASELPVPMYGQFNRLKGGKSWLFEVVHLPLERFSLQTPEAWNEQQSCLLATHPELHCHKLSETRILIDLSQALVGQQSLDKPLLVLCVDQLLGKVVLNTAFKCGLHKDRVRTLFRINKTTTIANGLAHIVQLVLDVCRPFYLKSLEESKSEQEELCHNVHNSQKLAVQVQPTNVYTILEAQKGCSSAAGQAFELIYPQTTEKAQEEDVLSDISDFETIDMEEFEDGEELKEVEVLEKQVVAEVEKVPVVEVCEQCGDKQDSVMVHMLDACCHRFCSGCLAGVVMNQLEMAKLPIKCLNSVCECELPLEVLQLVLPLPLANYTATIHHLTAQLGAGNVVSECTSCHDLICVDGPGDFGQLCCTKCRVNWCFYCRKQPHWPLKCAQANEWSKKFEQQYQLDRQRAAVALQTSLPSSPANRSQSPTQHNTIAQQFSLICSESRTRRLDTKTSRQLAKNMRRLTTTTNSSQPAPKWQSQFVEIRKTALYLLEYGYAWLYMNRNAVQNTRPEEWPQIKGMLCNLRRKVEALDSELLFSSSLTDAQALVDKLNKVDQLVRKIIEKFLAEPFN